MCVQVVLSAASMDGTTVTVGAVTLPASTVPQTVPITATLPDDDIVDFHYELPILLSVRCMVPVLATWGLVCVLCVCVCSTHSTSLLLPFVLHGTLCPCFPPPPILPSLAGVGDE
jgi:hypothetical protein